MQSRQQRRQLGWLEEQTLIWNAQRGDQKAVDKLVRDNDPMVVALAARISHLTGADVKRMREDVEQRGRLVLYERIYGYDFQCPTMWMWTRYLTFAVTGTRPARLFSYAFRKIVSAMYQESCDGLEIVRLPRSSAVHAAHRAVDYGATPEEVAQATGLDLETVESLVRVTLPEQDGDPDAAEDPHAISECNQDGIEARQMAEYALVNMQPENRAALVLKCAVDDPKTRAEIQGVSEFDLWLLERDAEKEMYSLLEAV